MVAMLLGLVGSAGCGGGDQPAAPVPPPIDVAGTTWELQSGTVDGDALLVPDGHRITLLVEADQAGGTSACNGYGASWSADGEQVTVGVASGTEMACEPDVMAAESTYLDALPRVTSAARDGDRLRLTGDGVDLLFTAQADVPTEALIGTTWELDTLVDGETAASTTGEPATLRLDEDGTLTGSTGCRELSGEYVVRGDEVLFTSFGADGECPEELAAQDSHVVGVLGDGFRAAVDGDRLTLTSDGALGLGYRAGS